MDRDACDDRMEEIELAPLRRRIVEHEPHDMRQDGAHCRSAVQGFDSHDTAVMRDVELTLTLDCIPDDCGLVK